MSEPVVTVVNTSDGTGKSLMWRCEGCGDVHMIPVEGKPQGNAGPWSWNGSLLRPTLTPSILKVPPPGGRCHSFVRDGAVQFLGDCDHDLAGKTVPMKPELAQPFAGAAEGIE